MPLALQTPICDRKLKLEIALGHSAEVIACALGTTRTRSVLTRFSGC